MKSTPIFGKIALIISLTIVSIPIALVLVYIILLFLLPSRSVEDISSTSQVIGKMYTTQFPLLYIENIPFDGDADEYTRSSSTTALTREASSELIDFQGHGRFLDEKSLVTPIRINLVVEGTVFKVLKKLKYHVRHIGSGGAYNYYLLEDSQGNASQVSSWSFDDYFVRPESNRAISWSDLEENEGWNPRTIVAIQEDGHAKASYCPSDSWLREEPKESVQARISKLVKDFGLENDMVWQKYAQKEWHYCVKLTFSSVESYMTMKYYMFRWGLHNKLNTYD